MSSDLKDQLRTHLHNARHELAALPWWTPLAAVATIVAIYYLKPFFVDYGALRDIPGPFPAQFTDLWLFRVVRRGDRYITVDKLHKELGTLVRIQPNHVSVASDDAIKKIYGHGNGFLKSDFYDAFVSIRRGLFNTRDRAEHTRKRKVVSHTFSVKSVREFEPYMHHNLELFVKQWDNLIESGKPKMDCLDWFNYLAFDMIGDLAFGAPFGMLQAGADVAELRATPTSKPEYAPAIEILNRRGEISATLGIMPSLIPYAKYLPDPFFTKGVEAVANLAKIAIASVDKRLKYPPKDARADLLTRLQEGRDDKGRPIVREELTAEALTQLIAGSDTTSNSSCALLFYAAKTPGVLAKLQQELDEAIPDGTDVPTFDMIKDLPYLQNVFNETLRYHSTSGIGLPRQVPPESPGVTIEGHYFPAGTVLSVPTYTIHHSKEIWGPDADDFNPDRWDNATARQKDAFIPFSHGPRSCVGRNVAEMEMKLIAATWAYRYQPTLLQDYMDTKEGFLRKPLALNISIKRRQHGERA
ncbi:Benzoate 4-monooxygenase [Vanrija pseudolonga]|uniref:Benzoate 4-monooxygenase bphA n=1 Tax=Vanrija pseudolonga TaxID=143232 RepID=A0AAF0Y2J1_9TREE|nr:Benzoate 4-monooxygenase [Vanrija pseudolonga]